MKILIILISPLLTMTAFDPYLFRRLESLGSINGIEIGLEHGAETFRQKKKIQRHRLDVIPLRHRDLPKVVRSRCNYRGTASRDVRSSDQRKIRRRFNNA